MTPTTNTRIEGLAPLIAPSALKAELPVSAHAQATVLAGRKTVQNILTGADERMLVVVGPCSIHDVRGAMDYAEKLAALRHELSDVYSIVMRTYFEKPRTTVGWKGLINDPSLDGSTDMDRGLHLARQLLRDVAELGLPTATEFLDPFTPQYLDDLVSWAAIGARTTESQTHRTMASGLSMPVGFKNGTDGGLQVAVDAMTSARSAHTFLGIDPEGRVCMVKTQGNPYGHMVLRGGHLRTNYDAESIAEAAARLEKVGLPTGLMVDCSHANSGKVPAKQEMVWRSAIEQRAAGSPALMAVMLESNLHEGAQKIPADKSELDYGVSITDACISFETTERLLREGAEVLRAQVRNQVVGAGV
ncbi:MAG: 3-deoxy-7-phosphoheptulonate synthase [Verrucomicrobiota bacterium]